jgi:tetratricopeptide (TPR) repeat protein
MHERLKSDPDTVAVGINNLALLRRGQGRLQDALPMAERAYEMLRPLDDPATTLWALGTVWGIRRDLGQVGDSVRMFEEIVAKYLELVPPTHTRILGKRRDIAYGRYLLGDYAEAERQYAALEADIRRAHDGHSVQLARVLQVHALLDRDQGRLDDAERRLRTALTDHLAATPPTHFDIPSIRRNLAQVLIDRGELAEAESQLRTALALLPDAKSLPHIERARTLMTLARLQTIRHRWSDAETSLREARTIVLVTTGDGSLDMGRLLLREGLLLQDRGDVAAARDRLRRAVPILQARLPPQQHRRVAAERALQALAPAAGS